MANYIPNDWRDNDITNRYIRYRRTGPHKTTGPTTVYKKLECTKKIERWGIPITKYRVGIATLEIPPESKLVRLLYGTFGDIRFDQAFVKKIEYINDKDKYISDDYVCTSEIYNLENYPLNFKVGQMVNFIDNDQLNENQHDLEGPGISAYFSKKESKN
ncbi:hypothetical protein qu_862 [Acanthamoeba polyphaga mimivirus]|uniref:Uncharacterized protein n=1 Tax=Acanthamoeba polyphaga mimivirus TaxID=212035 RepID=A0A0G2Y1P0_MIMIV|nr:hypothetical protein [Acanthamoeba polyphaga mimivirus]QTF49753.1 hypothetical protein [Mimivirus reunion]WMV62196.1 hypothetical protein qu_862 [Mimivirus sp.]WMV63173.1 hypothetical protein qu_862 [Acanthamoeba polyphaga mimivirus]WMV64150.1 hypothetical protein qu_862 [Mimivirus sp.]